jgi:GT2 family glycosyltransferase
MLKDTVSVIIVNWNGFRWLNDCFSTLSKQSYKQTEIIFVDNASHDGSVEWIKKHYPKTKIIVNKENVGFAEGNNIGYRYANGEYILFLNNDTRVSENFIIELLHTIKSDPSIGGIQSKILLMDDPTKLDSIGAFLTPTGFLYHNAFGKKDSRKYNVPIDLFTAKGACMFFRKSVLDTCLLEGNIFDPKFFAYFEETDLCHRVWLSGYRIVYEPKSVIYHKMGATSGNIQNDIIQFHSYKNRICSYIKNLGIISLLSILPVHIGLCIIFSFYSLIKGQWKIFLAIQKAIFWNITNLNKTLDKRVFIQTNIRKRNDEKLMPMIMKHPRLIYYIQSFFQNVTGYEE